MTMYSLSSNGGSLFSCPWKVELPSLLHREKYLLRPDIRKSKDFAII